ncbi:uncharacterized protein FA14DRAFT_182463 [Meira miltonrushii]|uniref:Uncharacterized protein n=1 Tax=Meira miltonrushii TaxID=1280837 RepID=A0A316V2I4_9BASI|nr:uncharacterized protein FA14DRAFT_182463 [Meira miltonrushii]PWN31672.1 hypothetical protein FA14DRAFT_182463 [Meira miltonrushii]
MSHNQFLVFDPKRKRGQSIEAAMASISNMINSLDNEEETGTNSSIDNRTGYQGDETTENIEDDVLDPFTLPPNTIMTRQDTFGEIPQPSFMAPRQSSERFSLPSSPKWSWKSDNASGNETFHSLERNPSLDYGSSASNASVREARRVSIRQSSTMKRSPDVDTLRKSYSCGNFHLSGQGMITPTQERYEGFPYKMTNVPTLNLARHTRDSSFSISSPETVLTSYFSDTEDIETPESPYFNTHEDNFSPKPTLRQIRNSFLDPGPSRESSANGFKIKPLTLTLSPRTKSEAINKIMRERKDSSNDHRGDHHTMDGTPMRYHNSEPINEAERLIQSYFADTNLMRQHLYNEYNATQQQSQPDAEVRQSSIDLFKSDAEVLLDISTGGWGGKYSTGEDVPPLLYHESSAEYFREQMPVMKAEKMVENEFLETIDSDQTPTKEIPTNLLAIQTPTNEFATDPLATQTPTKELTANPLATQAPINESEQNPVATQVQLGESAKNETTTVTQKKKPQALQVQKKKKLAPPIIPPKSPRRPQTAMMRSASRSLDIERIPGLAEELSKTQESVPEVPILDIPVKRKDFVDDLKPEIKQTPVPMPVKPRMLRSSRSENALDRFYNSGQASMKGEDPLLTDDRTSLTLSRLGFNSNTNFNMNFNTNFNTDFNANFAKSHQLYKPKLVDSGSDEDLAFSTNVTPSSQRSSRLIRSVAALKSLSKRFTSRKSQMVDFTQKIQASKEALEKNTTMTKNPEPTDYSVRNTSPISPGKRFDHHASNSDPLRDTNPTDFEMERSRSFSPVQQTHPRSPWPNKKAPKSPMVAANKTQNYF